MVILDTGLPSFSGSVQDIFEEKVVSAISSQLVSQVFCHVNFLATNTVS